MKNLLYLLLGSALLVSPSLAQTNTAAGRDISLSEFRQSLYDIGAMIDAQRGTNYAVQVQNIPDDTLAGWYKGVPHGRRFQEAVRALKAAREGRGTPAPPRRAPDSLAIAALQQRATPMASPLALSSPFASGISSVTAPSYALTPPPYPNPDPVSGDLNWQYMVSQIIYWTGLYTSGGQMLPSSLADAAHSPCDSNLEAKFTVLVATLSGIKDMAKSVCEIVPNIFVEILGEGAEIPAKEICFAITLIISGFEEWAEALATDCDTQDRIVNVAESEAGYANSVAIYNLKLRLKIEENLNNPGNPVGLFELPSSLGGFLEIARAIVSETITKMQNIGNAQNNALQQLSLGDAAFASRSYKQAYKYYQTAYGYAAKLP